MKNQANAMKKLAIVLLVCLALALALVGCGKVYRVNVTKVGNGTVSDGRSYTVGKKVTLTATPDEGWLFDGWYKNDVRVCETTTYEFTMPGETVNLQAKFVEPQPYGLTLKVTGTGTVGGAGNYLSGAIAALRVTSNAELFLGWYLNGALLSANAEFDYTMPAEAVTIYAVFNNQRLSIAVTGNGQTTGAGAYTIGSVVNLTATPADGYYFDGWYYDGELLSRNGEYAYAFNGECEITALFKLIEWEGDGTEASPYMIYVAEQLGLLSDRVNGGNSYADKFFALGRDVDLGGGVWTPIGHWPAITSGELNNFSGTFDGAGFSVTNYTLNTHNYFETYQSLSGLFGALKNAHIKNLNVSCEITIDTIGKEILCGGIAGYAVDSVFTDCTADVVASIDNTYVTFLGGIAGYTEGTSFFGCTATGEYENLNAWTHTGGITGRIIGGQIAGCSADVIINQTLVDAFDNTGFAGGIVAMNEYGVVTGCYATGEINIAGAFVSVGGIAGGNITKKNSASDFGVISLCTAEVTIYALGTTELETEINEFAIQANVGGIVGTNNGSKIYGCISSSDLSAACYKNEWTNIRIGGIAGISAINTSIGGGSTIDKCGSIGSILVVTNSVLNGGKAEDVRAGGIVGYALYSDISNCVSLCDIDLTVTYNINIGRIIGVLNAANGGSVTVENCYGYEGQVLTAHSRMYEIDGIRERIFVSTWYADATEAMLASDGFFSETLDWESDILNLRLFESIKLPQPVIG